MGRKSTKQDKCIYQVKCEEAGLSREKAAALLRTVSEDRIGRIELKGRTPHPDEVVAMAEGYNAPALCNHYCATQCPIGKRNPMMPEVRDLPTAVLECISSLNAIERYKDRLIEIAADSKVDNTEAADFEAIQEALRKVSLAVESLRLWSESAIVEE